MTHGIIELRQYTLREGQRDVLIALFEKEFIESQEVLGMRIIGTFRDLDRPDRFVWIRGFRDMDARAEGLNAFYNGPVWQKHRNAANATMIDSDNVLLLRPAHANSGFPSGSVSDTPKGLVIATIYAFAGEVGSEFVEYFDSVVKDPAVRAEYVSETSPNTFPRLPVREKDRVFVYFSVFANQAEYEKHLANTQWQTIAAELQRRASGPPEILRLEPTARSAFPGGAGDFDFLIGHWSVRHQRLERRLADDTHWIEFAGPASARKFLGGMGNVDEIRIDLPEGSYTGATVRLYNPGTRAWSIYWMDSRDPKMDPPMVGRFENGRGIFFGDDTFGGKPIRVRFIWTPVSRTECRWEQAFSADGGKSWETNWIMTFTRTK